jgi:urea transport system permease protein
MNKFAKLLFAVFTTIAVLAAAPAAAQTSGADFGEVVQSNSALIIKGSVKTIGPVIEAIQSTEAPEAAVFLDTWQNKDLWFRRSDDLIVYVRTDDKNTYALLDIATGETIGEADKKEIKQIKPNSGVRALIDAAMVQFRLTSKDKAERLSSLDSLERDPKPEHLAPLRKAIERETDEAIKAKMQRLERLLTMQYGLTEEARVEAIRGFSGDLGLDVRGRLNPLLDTRIFVGDAPPDSDHLARIILPGKSRVNDDGTARVNHFVDWFREVPAEMSVDEAYEMLAREGMAPTPVSNVEIKAALVANMADGKVGGVEVAALNLPENRAKAYAALVQAGVAPHAASEAEKAERVQAATFYALYTEPSMAVVEATRATLADINFKVSLSRAADLFLDGLSLASIYFLAAIGLAITFGVMRVINMAHGEFIMMGAYTGYVVQQFITNYTLSIVVAIPAAFAVTFAAGVAMERLVIRHLYHRPLETLLATFGISIALQQLAKNFFGTQARPLTSPDWLDGALVINDVISISWIRIAIFGLSVLFFLMLMFTLNKTRLGLETRAVTQNPRMAASMGINTDRINMLTFGLGSGIAGIAGVAIGLFAKVTSELGSDYIVQSFMTVVVGGVGNLWGTLAGAVMIGFFQKSIEFLNPSNTLAAQTYMIVFIIIFIQFRPRGIIALRGRAAEA